MELLECCGRKMAVAEYGDPAGEPVLFCHGWPSSRTMAMITDDAARELGLRIISPDRPGICDSEFCAERKLLDWPKMVRALGEHYGVGQWRVLGISGGAPYAFVTAWAMPEQVKAVTVVCGVPPISELDRYDGLFPLHRRMLELHARWPRLLRALFHVARPLVRVRPPVRLRSFMLRVLQPCDAKVLRDSRAFEACFESARQAWRGSALGVMTDAHVYAAPWGFPVEEVRVPVRLWHGKKDRTFSYRFTEEMSRRLPNCQLRLVEDAGHYSLPIRNIHEILVDLAAA